MDELLIRQAPHSPEAEQAVLGSMLIDADCVKDVMDKLQPEDFYLRQNREIFETIYSMFVYSKPIDGVTVAGEMERSGLYTDDTRGYLVQLMEVTPTSANVMEYVKIVREKALLRAVASAAADITAMVQEGTGEANAVLEAAEQKIYAIRRGRSAQNMVPISMVLQAVLERLGELTAAGGETMPGLTTGFSDVDRKINGLNKSDLLLLAGRPGMGKTSMGLNVAVNAAKASRKTVAVFSLEMSREQLVTRLLAGEGLIDNTRLVTGNLRESDWVRIAEGASTLSRLDIRIDDNPLLTVADMNAKCRRLDDLGLVVIDYLQLMTSAGGKGYSGENRQQAVSDISRMLKIMAKELQVPVLCLSQLSRANEKRDDKRPHAVRPPGVRRHRAGRGHRDVPVPGRLLQFRFRKTQHCRVHRGQKPPRGNRQGGAAVAAGIHLLRHPGKPLSGGELMDLRPFMERWHMLPPSGGVMLVAVSGGRDSVCLLHYLAAMPRDFTVAAAHLNHGRGWTSRRWPSCAGSWTFP